MTELFHQLVRTSFAARLYVHGLGTDENTSRRCLLHLQKSITFTAQSVRVTSQYALLPASIVCIRLCFANDVNSKCKWPTFAKAASTCRKFHFRAFTENHGNFKDETGEGEALEGVCGCDASQ